MEFVTPIITPIVNSLLVPVKKHLGFFLYFPNTVGEMHAKVRELDGAAHDMHTRQVSNQVNSRVVPHRVSHWLAEVEEIKSKIAEEIPPGAIECFNMKIRYKVGKKSSRILEDIDRLMKEKSIMEWTDVRIPLGAITPPRLSTSATIHKDNQSKKENIINSRDSIFNDALKCLIINNIKTQKIALCGMAGVGKTIMMKQLKKAAKDRKVFDCILTVHVGEDLDLLVIQQTVAEFIGENITETTKYTRAERLHKRFDKISQEGNKKILLILDDVWEKFNLEDIGLKYALPNGFKLLLTTRDENVCTQMGVETSVIFKIDVLKDVEAKKLFWETTGLVSNSDIDPNLHRIGEDIVKRCRGLPIAITTITSALKDNKEKDEWEDALSRLQKRKCDDYNIKAIFEISYKNLKEDDLKAIFILSGLFPEDYNIGKEDLLRYGWGLKFFQNVHTIAEARRRVNTCVNKLLRSNLLVKSDREGCVKMHDLVRDFVLSNFSNVKQTSIVNHNSNVSQQLKEEDSYDRILLKCGCMLEFPIEFKNSNLELLKLMDGDKLLKFPKECFSRTKKLKIVAYENMHRPLLPHNLTNLRALFLCSCSLDEDDISSIGDLINLEVLSIIDYGIHKLPSRIGKLKMLKLLDLTGCANLCIDNDVLQNLEKLEELYMGVSIRSSIRLTEASFELKMQTLSALAFEFYRNKAQPTNVTFENLERFRISIGCLLEKRRSMWGYSDQYSLKSTLNLVTSSTEIVESKINELFRKTEILHLEVSDMSYIEDIIVHPPQTSFCNLKELRISACARLTYIFTIHVAKCLTKLENLVIRSCHDLKSVINGDHSEVGVITFHKLKTLSLYNLPELVSLCDPVNTMQFPQLVDIYLNGLPNISSIFPHNNISIFSKQPLLNKEVVIPSLEELVIVNMKNLKEIWPCEITSSEKDVNSISMLTVIDCNSLINLFPINPMRLLSRLEKLIVSKCGSIEELFTIDLEQLSEVWRIKDAQNNYSGHVIRGFQAVKSVYISGCERFRNIMTPIHVNFDMVALEEISIKFYEEYNERNNELIKECQEDNSMSKEDLSYQLIHNFHNLRKIDISSYKGVKVIFDIESPSSSNQFLKSQQSLPLLPFLEYLELKHMKNMTHVWKCNNWNELFILYEHQPQSSFKNLTTIYLFGCNNINYLFSPLMVKLLSNLTKVIISYCDGMENVISDRDDKNEEMEASSTHTRTTLLPHLDFLRLNKLENLKHIGGGVAIGSTNVNNGQSKFHHVDAFTWSLCQYSREINIKRCDALSSVIPSYAAGQMQKLQVLSIEYCRSMMEVFETKEIISNHSSGCSSTTIASPSPTYSTMHKFPNLKILNIEGCDSLENILAFSTIESLKKLEKLTIRYCKAMKVVVRKECREHITMSMKEVVFPRLKSIELDCLPNLLGFFLGTNIDFQWPLLDYVMINDCPEMVMFTSGRSTTPRLKYIHTQLGKHNLECGLNFYVKPMLHQTPSESLYDKGLEGRRWSFHNLIDCNWGYYYDTKIFLSNELQKLQKLETIHVKDCTNVEEVFEVGLGVTNNESQTVVKFPKLRKVDLDGLRSLKYIWKSSQRRILEFPNLTILSISKCNTLEHVFTCSMVGCIMLHIQSSRNMKVILKEDEDHDVKVNEVLFPCLKSLKLDDLSSLSAFCSGEDDITFSSLDILVIKKCPKTMIFTMGRSVTPQLTMVETSFGSFKAWEDINSFIMTKKQEGYAF